ncbi:mycothiol system anti-sigma-R factor [Georgenia sp. SYP-B2076]|uniref:mycothiol system anti-sigma-R factor n=1 Tax=Georgenia sp. SYP-B2076 TaxID=2495881 RepID=UPI000F8D702C|nr:mycothiol system anti-sigma-R factor [Georgenia sp. SYP-B2076]
MTDEQRDLVDRAEQALLAQAGGKERQCTCEELLDNLMEFLDSELDEDQEARFRAHAEDCPTCHEAADAEQHIRSIVRRSCAEVAPSSLRLRVESQLSVLRVTGIRAAD